jgi:hypothetical protein
MIVCSRSTMKTCVLFNTKNHHQENNEKCQNKIYIYKTECLFVCIFCMQIYSFTPILMKFCTLDLLNKTKITVYFNFTKTNPYYHFQPC